MIHKLSLIICSLIIIQCSHSVPLSQQEIEYDWSPFRQRRQMSIPFHDFFNSMMTYPFPFPVMPIYPGFDQAVTHVSQTNGNLVSAQATSFESGGHTSAFVSSVNHEGTPVHSAVVSGSGPASAAAAHVDSTGVQTHFVSINPTDSPNPTTPSP